MNLLERAEQIYKGFREIEIGHRICPNCLGIAKPHKHCKSASALPQEYFLNTCKRCWERPFKMQNQNEKQLKFVTENIDKFIT